MRINRSLILSIGCGAVAAVVAALYLHMKEREVSGGSEPVRVLVAACDIKQNTLITSGLLDYKKIPRLFVQPGALTVPEEAVGKVSIAKIGRGEQILGTKLVAGGKDTGLSFKIPNGKRAISVELRDDQAAGGLIEPDDSVDVAVTFDFGDGEHSEKDTYMLFQDVPVIAVDSKTYSLRDPLGVAIVEKKSSGMFGSAPAVSGVKSNSKVFTLLLDADDAGKLIFAKLSGDIQLLLRAPTDRAVFRELQPVKMETVAGRGGMIHKAYKEYRGR